MKLFLDIYDFETDVSPSSRGRGLKSQAVSGCSDLHNVALFTRAWIEIEIFEKLNSHLVGRPLHEGVD